MGQAQRVRGLISIMGADSGKVCRSRISRFGKPGL